MTTQFIVSFPTNPAVGVKVVRAFPASEVARRDFGIIANFSVQLVSCNKKGEETGFPLASINSLMLKIDRNGDTYITSKGEKIPGANGDQLLFPFTFYPGANRGTDEHVGIYDAFVKKVTEAVKHFILFAKERAANSEGRRYDIKPVDPAAAAIASMVAPKKQKSDEPQAVSDLPL